MVAGPYRVWWREPSISAVIPRRGHGPRTMPPAKAGAGPMHADSCNVAPTEFTGPSSLALLARAKNLGYAAQASAEYEFFLFEETPHSVREKHFRDLRTITPGYFGYSLLRASVYAEFYEDLLKLCEAMCFPLEGLHTETGPGVVEAAITYADAVEAADRAALFKTYTKILAERRGWMATFMAKWSRDWPGQSGHLHISLHDKRGRPAFHDAKQPHHISDTMRWFIGGQQALLPEFLAMVAPTVNSYTRLIPGFWAPTDASW